MGSLRTELKASIQPEPEALKIASADCATGVASANIIISQAHC